MPSIFSKIIAGEISSYKVAETVDYLAFLDAFPIAKGHVLVIPKKEVDYIFDLEDETLVGLNLFAKKVAQGVQKVIPCKRVGIAVIGLEVPHTHIHLVPINEVGDINFSKPKMKFSEEEMKEIAQKISSNISL